MVYNHRREHSESSVTIRDRSKPVPDNAAIPIKTSKHQSWSEHKILETLPQGTKAADAPSMYCQVELEALRRQALEQAVNFEVLCAKDVDAQSRELRALDERCKYLRKTHASFRSGRRNLHEGICNYLRFQPLAGFSHDIFLKQEEALAELDLSIDVLMEKLERAEKRLARVRQKLLEHFAAVLTLPVTAAVSAPDSTRKERGATGTSRDVLGHRDEDTPPCSPKNLHCPVIRPKRKPLRTNNTHHPPTRSNFDQLSPESVHIYFESDVQGLLAEVEEEMDRMATGTGMARKER
ncbi:MAG: hypothetical protein M1818_002705 [Claussenomyces sp. TS43310]|nr:MAG: hypothetical protein M1818_002705 [Claussenomyces sp. TS43310]